MASDSNTSGESAHPQVRNTALSLHFPRNIYLQDFRAPIEHLLDSNSILLTPDFNNINEQPANSPRRSGTISIPLCVQTEEFNENSPHWEAGMTFLRSIKPLITASSNSMYISYDSETSKKLKQECRETSSKPAIDLRDEPDEKDHCLHSMKLSVNIAHEPMLLGVGLETPCIIVVVLANQVRMTLRSENDMTHGWVDASCVIISSTTQLGVEKFGVEKGDRYQLEFYLAPGKYLTADEVMLLKPKLSAMLGR